MIYITGDTHQDFTRFGSRKFPEQKLLTRNDYVIICGDFGIWDETAESLYWLKWLDNKPFTTLFVDGNHENFDLLSRFPEKEWNGGKVHQIREHIFHLMRGQIFELDGQTFFTMGGASSHDMPGGVLDSESPDYHRQKKRLEKLKIRYRVNHLSWWQEELPCEEEYREALYNLEKQNWQVDTIITHCAPDSIAEQINPLSPSDALTRFLEEVKNRCRFRRWFFGHYHEDCKNGVPTIEEPFSLQLEEISVLREK